MSGEVLKIIPEVNEDPQDGDTRTVVFPLGPYVTIGIQQYSAPSRGDPKGGWKVEKETPFVDLEVVGLG